MAFIVNLAEFDAAGSTAEVAEALRALRHSVLGNGIGVWGDLREPTGPEVWRLTESRHPRAVGRVLNGPVARWAGFLLSSSFP